MGQEHLDLIGIDAVRAGDATPEQSEHVESCAECRGTLSEITGLAAEVRKLDRPLVDVPADVDRKIVTRRRRLPMWPPIAAAAGLLLAIGMGLILMPPDRQTEMMAGRPEDVDQSGGVDILDAYALATRIRNGETLDQEWDFDGDGRVDEKDVDVIARECVALGGKPK